MATTLHVSVDRLKDSAKFWIKGVNSSSTDLPYRLCVQRSYIDKIMSCLQLPKPPKIRNGRSTLSAVWLRLICKVDKKKPGETIKLWVMLNGSYKCHKNPLITGLRSRWKGLSFLTHLCLCLVVCAVAEMNRKNELMPDIYFRLLV